jgi:hypothetical protein
MKQPHVHNEPLREGDRPDRTVGCRHTNPDVCGKHSIEKVCAFVRDDNMCLAPPVSWKKQYERLASMKDTPQGQPITHTLSEEPYSEPAD